MTDIDKLTTKLLHLSNLICTTMTELEDLSANDLEKTDEFNKKTIRLNTYLDEETNIINNISKEQLTIILKNMYNNISFSIARNRSCANIEDHLDRLDQEDYEFDYEFDETYDTYKELFFPESNETSYDLFNIEQYYINDEDIEIYRKYVIHRNAIRAIKDMYTILNTAKANNDISRNYQKELIFNLKRFKYTFFTIDNDLEKLGVKYHFNIHNIPDIEKIDLDLSPICYNECIDILDRLYSLDNGERGIDEICDALYDMSCFNTYIPDLNDEQIESLINFCYEMEKITPRNLFGGCGLEKLVKIKRKKN